MTLKIYGDSRSGNCLKVRWTAAKLGLPYDWVEVDAVDGSTRSAAFLEINPAGQVPTAILDDGRVLAQSNAIILHLADGSNLIPSNAYDRAKMFEWLFWEQYSHEPYIAVARAKRIFAQYSNAASDDTLMRRGEAALARMELQLAQTPYLVGQTLSLADVALVAYTRLAHEGGFELGVYPALRAWIQRTEAALRIVG